MIAIMCKRCGRYKAHFYKRDDINKIVYFKCDTCGFVFNPTIKEIA